MATVLRPPLVFRPQVRPWVAAVDPIVRPLTLGINPNAQVQQLSASAPLRAPRLSLDSYPNLLQTTLAAAPSLALPLLARQQNESAPIGRYRVQLDGYPNLVQTTFSSLTTFAAPLSSEVLDDSAPFARGRVQVDGYPNLSITTLVPGTIPLPLSAIQWSDSAPPVRGRVQVDVLPNLSATTLAPVTIPLPLAALRWDWPAPIPPKRVQIDQPMQRPVWLDPVPTFLQWNESAPPAKYRPQVDVYPNITVLGINPNATPAQLNDSAPPARYRIQLDTYPNLSVSTLLALVTVPNVVGETQAQAQTDITGVGLTYSVSTDYSDTVAAGLVISQTPAGGTVVASGSNVAIDISLGVRLISTDAGRRRYRDIYRITVDGQVFEFATYERALAFLAHMREVAKQHAPVVAKAAVAKKSSATAPAIISTPKVVSNSRDLRPAITAAKRDIAEIYRQAAIDEEIAVLIELGNRSDHNDDALILLM